MGRKALAGVKVVEYASFAAGPFCAKLLADLGAEVIKIEQPGKGDQSRRYGPFPHDVPHHEKSGLFLYLNTNKLGITLNMDSAAGLKIFLQMIESADILIEDNSPARNKELGIGYESVNRINPGLIMTSITPFGQNGPYAGYKSYYLNTYHSGMLGYITPCAASDPERFPVRGAGLMGETGCGVIAAVAILGALYSRRLGGRGQHIDVSKQEALLIYGRVDAARYANEKINPGRQARFSGAVGMVECSDGYMMVHIVEDGQWSALVQAMGNPDWATDQKYRARDDRGKNLPEIMPRINEWAKSRSKMEIYHRAQEAGCPVTPVLTSEEVLNSAQMKSRNFFSEADHQVAGKFLYPGSPYQFSRTPAKIDRPAPLLGEHNQEILGKRLGYSANELAQMAAAGII